MSKYTVATYPEGEIAGIYDDLGDAIDKASEIEGFVIDEDGNDVEW